MNMTPSAACATCEICLPLLSTNLRRTILNWRADIEAKTLGLWRRQSFGSSTLLRVAMTVSLQLTQLVSGILICFQRARRRAQRPAMPPADAFGRLPLSSLSRTTS